MQFKSNFQIRLAAILFGMLFFIGFTQEVSQSQNLIFKTNSNPQMAQAETSTPCPTEQPQKLHKKKNKPAAVTDPIQQGKDLLESRCSTCHTAPQPSVHTLSEWPAVLNRMAPRAFLSPSEEDLIKQYLQSVLTK